MLNGEDVFASERERNMDRLLSESTIVRTVAQTVAQRITRQVIASLQGIKDTLSGDDTELTSIWDEVCVQVQDEESFFWQAYDDTVRDVVGGAVAELPDFEREAMWLQTRAI